MMTNARRNVLQQLTNGPKLGRDLIAGSGRTLRKGSAYIKLARMEHLGLVNGEDANTNGRRYWISDRGKMRLAKDTLGRALWRLRARFFVNGVTFAGCLLGIVNSSEVLVIGALGGILGISALQLILLIREERPR